MATYKEISPGDITTSRSVLNQLVDIIEEDVSGSNTRKKYQVFVTGGVGPGVTSSLFQTIYDQDFSLQTANPIFDMTYGLRSGSDLVGQVSIGENPPGKMLFPSTSIMMREKVNVYNQFAQLLLGASTSAFTRPFSGDLVEDIDHALFINIKRLFARDSLKRETVAVRMYASAAYAPSGLPVPYPIVDGSAYDTSNINVTSDSGSIIFTDVGASANREVSPIGGPVASLVNSADTSQQVGLIFYEPGIMVIDLEQVISGTQHVSGVIGAMSNATTIDGASIVAGKTVIGSAAGNPQATFIPDLVVSASIDDVVDHFASCRFQSGTFSTMTFQNETNINSTLVFCRATADEFNYSSNPTYTDNNSDIVVITDGPAGSEKAFSFATSVGLYDANDNLLAVAKLSRPIEKNDEKDLTFRIRLDF